MTSLTRRPEGRDTAHFERFDPFRALRDMLRWDPFAEMEPMARGNESGFMPNIELRETKDALVIKVDLPGVGEDQIDVSVTGNRLTISGRRMEDKRDEGDRFYAYERVYGAFSRTITLPDDCDPENVKAELTNGVLTLVVPKRQNAQARRIDIGSGGAGRQQQLEAGKGEDHKGTKAA